MKCPKCGYKREKYESAPDWQCPSCGVAYEKYEEGRLAMQKSVRGYVAYKEAPGIGRFFKPLLAIAVIGAALWYTPPNWLRALKGDTPAAGEVRHSSGGDLSKARIVMYSLTTCGYCVSMRRTLQANGVPFTEYFVDTEPARFQELIDKMQAAGFKGGGIGTPTFEVNGKMMPNNPPFEAILKQARS